MQDESNRVFEKALIDALNHRIEAEIVKFNAQLGIANIRHVIDFLIDNPNLIKSLDPTKITKSLGEAGQILHTENPEAFQYLVQSLEKIDIKALQDLKPLFDALRAAKKARDLTAGKGVLSLLLKFGASADAGMRDLENQGIDQGIKLHSGEIFEQLKEQANQQLAESGQASLSKFQEALLAVALGVPFRAKPDDSLAFQMQRSLDAFMSLSEQTPEAFDQAIHEFEQTWTNAFSSGSGSDLDELQNNPNYNPDFDLNLDGLLDEQFKHADQDADGFLNQSEQELLNNELFEILITGHEPLALTENIAMANLDNELLSHIGHEIANGFLSGIGIDAGVLDNMMDSVTLPGLSDGTDGIPGQVNAQTMTQSLNNLNHNPVTDDSTINQQETLNQTIHIETPDPIRAGQKVAELTNIEYAVA